LFIGAGIRFHAENQHEALIGNSELRALSAPKRRSIVALRSRYQSRLEGLVQAAVDAGRITVPDVKLAAFAGVAICVHVASWYRPDGRLPLDEIEKVLVAMYAPATY
jgi:tetracycline repressor-like protein